MAFDLVLVRPLHGFGKISHGIEPELSINVPGSPCARAGVPVNGARQGKACKLRWWNTLTQPFASHGVNDRDNHGFIHGAPDYPTWIAADC